MLVYQNPNFALGNFIMITPAIKRLAEKHNRCIDVCFTKDYVKDCFLECKFINHVDKLYQQPVIDSGMVNRNIPDYKYSFQLVHGETWSEQYHTYVDSPDEYDFSDQKYLLILNGLAGESWKGKKEVSQDVHQFIKQHSTLPIYFTGSQTDLDVNSPWMSEIADKIELNNIRKALALVRDADIIISNDTGLSHAAGSFNKKMLILWKDTPFIKNQNPGKNTLYAQQHEWIEKTENFLKNNE